jgi:Ca-activated chloride channel family protein
MNLMVGLDRRLYGPAGARRHLWVRIEVPRISSPLPRPPLDVALVLDRSGSMSGAKIALAKQAAMLAVNLLRESDRCALVAYDDEVIKAVRCKPVDTTQRASLSRALAALEARNSTNLFGGWLAGAEEISEDEGGRVRRVLMLTDGLANVGITQPAEILRHVRELSLRGVGTSMFGVGLDFDEVLVSGMAEAGNGHFYYIERPEQIPDYLSSELGELLSVAARSATLAVLVSGGAQIHNLNDLPLLGALYQLGDLSENSVVDLCFVLDVAPGTPGPLNLEVTLTWQDPHTSATASASEGARIEAASEEECRAESPDRDTLLQAAKARAARVLSDAVKLNKARDFDKARDLVEAEIALLEEMAVDLPEAAEEASRLRDEVEHVAAPMAVGQSKAMLYDSYLKRHSRVDRHR